MPAALAQRQHPHFSRLESDRARLTSINILVDRVLDRTLIHLSHTLALQRLPVLTSREHTTRIHGLLQTVIFPPEEVVLSPTISDLSDKGWRALLTACVPYPLLSSYER